MTRIDTMSPEWRAIRGHAVARVSELTLALRGRQAPEETEDKRSRIEELLRLIREFEPEQVEAEPEIEYGV